MKGLDKREQIRLIRALGRAMAAGVDIEDHLLHEALLDILVREQWPAQKIVTLCSLDRRKHGRTTDPGGVDGPPFDRSLSDNVIEVDVEAGARAMGDDELGIPDERYTPP